MTFRRLSTAALCLIPVMAAAETRPAAVLVLDGSGSMWGQIEGTAKITIAQQVVGDLMQTLPQDLDLGLTVYGHRRKGDCSDIETLIAPGAGTHAAIAQAVNSIKPKGKTPMADSVVAAAQALRYTEDAATVILVSDGIETCVPDVCAVARELEETGVDFTAHVVGFDVSDPEAQAQFQCLAEATGGTFLSADDATSLTAALTQVAAAPEPKPEISPEPEPQPARIYMTAEEEFGSSVRSVDVLWEIVAEDGSPVMEPTQLPFHEATLPSGTYTIRAKRLSDGSLRERQITVGSGRRSEVKFVFSQILPDATLVAPSSGIAGDMVQVTWTGPDAPQDYIDTAPIGADNGTYVTYEYTSSGSPLMLRLPTEPGEYDIRYILAEGVQDLARIPITVTERGFSLNAPETAAVGATVNVGWTGGGFDEDYLVIAPTGSGPGDYLTYEYVRKGNPTPLRMPLTPGTYELRYVVGQDVSVGTSQPLTVMDISVTLTAPERAKAGESVNVSYDGPNYDGDYLTFVKPGADPGAYLTYEYTRAGNPLQIPAPEEPGTYELRYISTVAQTRVFAAVPVIVE
ncbi:MAG: VWA domain-containing protein [Rhodobacteraceae bacterium]|nr:VWA domain-containing protein [Paracoccaceae bacterium]